MKYRQAAKIVKQRHPCDIGYNSPTVDKAIVVYVHHRKKSNPNFYSSRGITRMIREFYEKKHNL